MSFAALIGGYDALTAHIAATTSTALAVRKIVFFNSCSYCGRAPDHMQTNANCGGCGAAMKPRDELAQARLDVATAAQNIIL